MSKRCEVPECTNLAFRDGLCAACHATREAVRQDRERFKRTGELPPYVKSEDKEDEEP